ncbi:hypothetical protein Egran_06820 [Elaphomyces granulatus]|uniref:Pumilio homology domain family member 3 n=1 Tax=Elaphomyces granulatus TaxID=519963 RepID=A0A232LMQ0_9EURO|nr:hypothetical protein Egran_06820 [Elaphomyces granulatus]
MNGERARPSQSTMGSGFTSTKTSWNSNIWGNGFGEGPSNPGVVREISDFSPTGTTENNVFEGKSSLFSSSESDGWNGRRNLPWSTVNTTTTSLSMAPNQTIATTMATSPVQNRLNDRNAPAVMEAGEKSYFALPRASTLGHTPSNSASKAYPNPASEPFSSANREAASFGNFMGFRHEDASGRRQLGSSSFGGNGVGSGFQQKPTFVPVDRDGNRTDGVVDRMSLPPFSQAAVDSTSSGPNRAGIPGPYAHLSRNSASFGSPRPVHSAHPSFHSETQAFDKCYVNGQMDINMAKLDLTDHNLLSQQSSQRPTFVPFQSYDPSYNRLKSPVVGDEGSVSQAPPYAPDGAPDLQQLGYHSGVPRLGDHDSTSSNGYNRGMNAAFYSAGGTTPVTATPYRTSSGNRLSNHANEGQAAALLDRKLRGVQQQEPDFVLPAGRHPLQPRPHFPAYEIPGFGAPPIAPFPGLYPVAPYSNLGATTIVPRGPHREHDSSQVVRSPLLEEFRSNNKGNKRYELKDIYNHIVEFSGDQHGSRFIQQKLETANSDEKEQVFREIQPNALQLMTDVFGNYVVQKLFEHGNQTQKKILANQMKGHILTLSTQMYGCRVVQKALEHILTDQQASMVKELECHVLKCVKDQNGNHVIQKAIERVPSQHVQFIINAFKGQVSRLATHPYGCRVIQRMLEHCQEADKQSILLELHACTTTLIPDQFGNYVIQHVIERGEEQDRSRIVALVISQLLVFSKHKFASNVVEKSIEFGEEGQRRDIIRLLTSSNERGESPLLGLMRDQYGNYVIQKVLGQVKDAEREALVEQIKPLLSQLKKFSYGKQIVAIEKLILDSRAPSPGTSSATANPSTTPPASHKSSPQPSRRSLTDIPGCRPPIGGAAPPTPPPTDTNSSHGGSTADSAVDIPVEPSIAPSQRL